MKKLWTTAIYIIASIVCGLMFMGAGVFDEAPTRLTIVADGKSYVYEDKRLEPSDFTVTEQLEARKINAPLAEKIAYIDECLSHGADYKTALERCCPLLVRTVSGVADELYVAPTDAEVVYGGGKFSVKSEKYGRRLEQNKLYASIYYALKFSGGGTVNASTERITPEVTSALLRENLIKRGEYTTDFSGSSKSRAHNVKLALSKLDGLKIDAGETLSFNRTVGERTERNGFRSAKIIVDGKYTDGVGGGVCQASTALYNAALLSGLDCHANAHSICPSYCPAGLDAMISSVSDLTVTNITAHPVYITVKISGGRATVGMFGEKNAYVIVPESVTLATTESQTIEQVDAEHKYFDSAADSGSRLLVSPGKDGVSSETYINIYKDGVLIARNKIRENTYRCVPRIIAVAP